MYYRVHVGYQNRDPGMHWPVEVSVPFWTKEKGSGVWDFPKERRQFTGRKNKHAANIF